MNLPLHNALERDARSTIHGFSDLSGVAAPGALKMISKGRGIWVFDGAGTPLLEAASGMWCASLGFGDEELADVASAQLRQLAYYHTMSGKTVLRSGELAARLLELSPIAAGGRVHLASSGSEANDFLVKFTWYANRAAGRPHKRKFITRKGGYHGATVVASSLTGLNSNQQGFGLPTADFLHTLEPHYHRNHLPGETEAQFCDRLVEDLKAIIEREGADTIAGFMAEPVSGAGGVLIPPAGYYERVQAVLQTNGIPLYADEVITGIGRLGDMFGSQTMGMQPAAITLGKGLTSAVFPLSAIIVDKDIADRMAHANDMNGSYFGHGSTYSGHPVGCAIALAVLDIMERRNLLAHVREVAVTFAQRIRQLQNHPLVGHTRAIGLMGAVELKTPPAGSPLHGKDLSKLVKGVAESRHELIFRALSGGVCAFSPPLIITAGEVHELFDRFTRALDDVLQQGAVVAAPSGALHA